MMRSPCVEYEETRQDQQALGIIRSCLERNAAPGADEFDWTISLGRMLFFKMPMFASEDEWRWVSSAKAGTVQSPRDVPGVPNSPRKINYISVPLKDQFVLREIVCGPLAKLRADRPEDLKELREMLRGAGYEPEAIEIRQSAFKLWR